MFSYHNVLQTWPAGSVQLFEVHKASFHSLQHRTHNASTVILFCVQTAHNSDSNQIPSQIRFLGLTLYTVFISPVSNGILALCRLGQIINP